MAAWKQQIIELDSLRAQIGQNQTDDQVFIQNENERLQGLLATKDSEIQNYQRQNLQLQMSFASAPATGDPFNSISAAAAHSSPPTSQIDELSKNIVELEVKLQTASTEVTALQEQNVELQTLNSQKDNWIHATNKEHDDRMTKLQNEFKDRLSELQQRNTELHHSGEEKEVELKRLQNENEKHSNVAVTQTKIDEMQMNIQQLEQYIADLQIQLRISTNDCEQTAQTIQSLEQEIQSRTVNYEAEIASLRLELNRLTIPQAVQEVFAQKTVASTTAAEPQQFLTDIENMIIPTGHSTNPPSSDQPSVLPSFNSSMFFGSIEPTAFDDPFSGSEPDSAFPPDHGNRTPVVEAIIVPKKAYLCHPDQSQSESTTDDLSEYSGRVPVVEEVCLIKTAYVCHPEEAKDLSVTDDSSEYSSRVPVVEGVCVVKKAYVCHPEEVDDLSQTDDGWGFGSDEAILEEKHQQMTGSVATSLLVPAHIEQTLKEYDDAVSFVILFKFPF